MADRHGMGLQELEGELQTEGGPVAMALRLVEPTRDVGHLAKLLELQLERQAWSGGVASVRWAALRLGRIEEAPGLLVRRRLRGGQVPDVQRPGRSAQQPIGGECRAARRTSFPTPSPSAWSDSSPGRTWNLRARRSRSSCPRKYRGAGPSGSCVIPSPSKCSSIVPDGPPIRMVWRGRDHPVIRCWGPERIATGWWRGAGRRARLLPRRMGARALRPGSTAIGGRVAGSCTVSSTEAIMPEQPPTKLHRPAPQAGPPPAVAAPVRYVELHCKTNFSFLEGASHPDELVAEAARLGYAGMAVTDRNSLAGAVRAHVAAREAGLKLVIGAEITLDRCGPYLVVGDGSRRLWTPLSTPDARPPPGAEGRVPPGLHGCRRARAGTADRACYCRRTANPSELIAMARGLSRSNLRSGRAASQPSTMAGDWTGGNEPPRRRECR